MLYMRSIYLRLFLYMIFPRKAISTENNTKLVNTLNNTIKNHVETRNISFTSLFPNNLRLDEGTSNSSHFAGQNNDSLGKGAKDDYGDDTNTSIGADYGDVEDDWNNYDENSDLLENRYDAKTVLWARFLQCLGNKRKQKHIIKCAEKMKDHDQTKNCTKPGFLVLTHVLSAVIGSGILYFALFLRKLKRALNIKNKEERNRSNSYLFLNQQSNSTEKISRINHHDEGVYCEVTEKPLSYPFHTDSFDDNSAPEGPKIARLPDIPQQLKDNDEYLTPLNKSPPYESLIWSGSTVTEATTMVEEEMWSKGSKNKIDILNEVDEINNTLDPELSHQYVVLEKSSEMHLK